LTGQSVAERDLYSMPVSARLLLALIGAATIAALRWPSASVADHVSVGGSVGATVERFGSDSWIVKVSFVISCRGAGSQGAAYQGTLALLDLDTGDEIFLGGISAASGGSAPVVHSIDRWQRLAPLMKVSCFDSESLHGSDRVAISDGEVFIPPRLTGVGGGGNGGGNGGRGGGSGDPSEPLGSGGCLALLVGTSRADTLIGEGGGDVIFGLGKADRIRGAGGHDCLIGGAGGDRLLGEEGSDRLTGGAGPDRLLGGPGINGYDAGPGRDFVDAANGRPELVRCGSGRDRVKADRRDILRSCELSST
jgi:Ca2+-binding RTX toxin-like protein